MSAPAPEAKKTGTQAIERAVAILRQFGDHDGGLGLSDIARATELTVATAHRILSTLVRERLLAYDPVAERYQIGADSLFLFVAAARRYGVEAARSELQALVEQTRETGSIALLDAEDAVVVMQIESDQPLRFARPVGTRLHMHVSALGKAVLAHSGRDIEAYVADLPDLPRFTDDTTTDRAELIAQLEEVRRRGWALNAGERYPGVTTVAVPIQFEGRPARAALGIQGPSSRLPASRLPDLVEQLQRVARRIAPLLAVDRV